MMLRKLSTRNSRRSAAKFSRFMRLATSVQMELLEQRVMLTASNPIAPPPLPNQPTPLQGIVGTPNSLDPQFINDAFEFNDLSYDISGTISRADGAGETIAIVDAFGSPTIVQDVQTFDAETYVSPLESIGTTFGGISDFDAEGKFFLSVVKLGATAGTYPPSFYTVQNGFPDGELGDEEGWAKETSLDVEWVHAIAPGAHILLVEAASDSPTDLLDADVFAAQQPGVVAVSDSWGGDVSHLQNPTSAFGLPPYTPSNDLSTLDGLLVTPTGHEDNDGLTGGVVFLASSGDTGANEFPASSPNVLSVGGETDTIDLNGVFENLGPWSGSGGGPSTTAPTYNNPIVAFDANPTTGVWIYDSTPDPSEGTPVDGGWDVVGGTSFAAPVWAGTVAIIDQGLNLRGFGSMDNDQVLGLTPYDDRGTTDPGDTGPTIQTVTPTGGQPIVTVLQDPASAYGILGLAENDLATNEDFTQLPTDVGGTPNNGGGMDVNFPLWPHKTNTVTVTGPGGTTTTTTTTPTNGSPDIIVTPVDDNTGWGLPNNDSGNIGLDETVAADSARGGFIQDMVGGPVGLTIFSDTVDSLYFTQQPTNTAVANPINSTSPGVQVTVFTPTTNGVDTSFNGPVTISILESGTLVGTTTVDAVNGVATFTGLSLDSTGVFEFVATAANVNPGYSNAFNETPAAAVKMVVETQPTSFWQYNTMSGSIVVLLEDQFGNISDANGVNVTLSIKSGPVGAQLTGQTSASAVNGIARFNGVGGTLPGAYVLTISSSGLPPITTSAFAIIPIPVTQHFTLNGAGLSEQAILLQQQRNAIVFAKSPPTAGQIAEILAESPAVIIKGAAANTPPASTFSNVAITSSADTGADSQLLDTTNQRNDKLMLN